MSKFIHELPEAEELFRTVAGEMGLDPIVVEKDYWIMHCLWGLCQQEFSFEVKGGTSLSKGWCCIERFSEDIDIRFDPTAGLNVSSEKDRHIEARFRFYDDLAQKIRIPGIEVKRDVAFDDSKARNAGISLNYPSCFSPIEGLRSGVGWYSSQELQLTRQSHDYYTCQKYEPSSPAAGATIFFGSIARRLSSVHEIS